MKGNKAKNFISDENKILSTDDYIKYNLLFLIPIVGLIFLIIFSFDKKNINRRNYAQSFFFTANIVIFIFLCILLLELYVFNYKKIVPANYNLFAQQFGEYADQVIIDGEYIKSQLNKEGFEINEAQKYYMIANGFKNISETESGDFLNKSIPVGYDIPNIIKESLDIKGKKEVVAYLITDNKITGYENNKKVEFYGNQNGIEAHFITSEGTVFTIPGFEEKQEDGSSKFYITAQGNYYIVTDNFEKNESITKQVRKEPLTMNDFKISFD
ncbi:MAG: hypothetical protein J6C46_10610 [Clostridia bacterium]|nr:hypothetical protein [Clostridia bacterium]